LLGDDIAVRFVATSLELTARCNYESEVKEALLVRIMIRHWRLNQWCKQAHSYLFVRPAMLIQ